jgi:hypothetical protein
LAFYFHILVLVEIKKNTLNSGRSLIIFPSYKKPDTVRLITLITTTNTSFNILLQIVTLYWGMSALFLCNTTTNNQIWCLWNEMQQQRDDFSPKPFSFVLEYAIWKFQKPGGKGIKRATSASEL